MGAPGGGLPDWYLPIRAARFGRVSVPEALGVAWSPILQEWCLIAESAEIEADNELAKQAAKAAQQKR